MSLFKLAVLISGTGSNLQAVIDAVSDGTIPNAKVEIVISSREGVYGLERAKNSGITNMVINRHDTATLLKTLETHEINGIVLAGYLAVLPPDVIMAYSGKIVNIHPALLPMFGGKGFYGIRVHLAVVASGVDYTGASAHLVDCGIDTGAVLVRSVVPVLEDESPENLGKRVLGIEHIVLVKAVKALVENKTEELAKKPITLINEEDREGVKRFAKGLTELGKALTDADKGDL